jgi:HAD superfamily hydrolase (TIGR01458 family)
MIKGVLLDLSGTVYVDNELFPGASEAISQLRARHIPVRFITNTSRSSRRTIVQKLGEFGLAIHETEVFTAPLAIRDYLVKHQLTPWLLVHPAIKAEFSDLVGAEPDAVVLGDAAAAFTYASLNHAFRLLLAGARLLAVGDNRYFKERDGLSLDAGPFVTALEYAADCQALILGKPSAAFFLTAAGQLGCKTEETLMIGDDVQSDVNGALRAGMKAALVQTGKYRPGDEHKISAPGARVCTDLLMAVASLGEP